MTTDGYYCAGEVLKIVRISYRQLDYWTKAGLAHPANSNETKRGKFRLYSPADILALKAAKRLLGAGVTLMRVKRAVRYLRKQAINTGNPLAQYTFIANGKQILVLTDDTGKLIDVTEGGQLVFAMALVREARELGRAGILNQAGRLEERKGLTSYASRAIRTPPSV